MSPKHLQRYVDEFAARDNIRDMDAIDQVRPVAFRMAGNRLPYDALKAPYPDGCRATRIRLPVDAQGPWGYSRFNGSAVRQEARGHTQGRCGARS